MAEVAHETHQEFWQPPTAVLADPVVIAPETTHTMAEVCPSCGTEFLLGSGFCHSCGRRRPEALSPHAKTDAAVIAGLLQKAVSAMGSVIVGIGRALGRLRVPGWFHHLHFRQIQRRIGLSTGSLIAFTVGLTCVGGTLAVGLMTAKTLVEWQAIQVYRGEWLLGATASFVAGILLKKPPND
jgi:uncharacterized OB-fold protein